MQNLNSVTQDSSNSTKDQEIFKRLLQLKEKKNASLPSSDKHIAERLQELKGPVNIVTDDEIKARLAKLRGIQMNVPENKVIYQAVFFCYTAQIYFRQYDIIFIGIRNVLLCSHLNYLSLWLCLHCLRSWSLSLCRIG